MKSATLALSVALAASCGSIARAQDHEGDIQRGETQSNRQQPPATPSEKTPEDIVNEATDRKAARRRTEWKPPMFYLGYATERSDLNVRTIVRPIQAAERDATSLRYLSAVENRSAGDTNGASDAYVIGARLSERLGIELLRREETNDTFHVTSSSARVLDPTLPAPVSVPRRQQHEGLQWSTLQYGAWELSVLPRWHFGNKGWKELLALYGRVGIGYAQTDVRTVTQSQLQELRPVRCTTEQAYYGCNGTQVVWEPIQGHSWNDVHSKDSGIFPVLGVGIELTPFIHVEHQLRASIPVAGKTINIRTLTLQVSF